MELREEFVELLAVMSNVHFDDEDGISFNIDTVEGFQTSLGIYDPIEIMKFINAYRVRDLAGLNNRPVRIQVRMKNGYIDYAQYLNPWKVSK
jgi:hypothetical protein